ncbi:hypothetical protein ACHAXA_007974 [Cyclostephanos tholiformis]|uniref:Cold shock domain-containing protein E1 n=1 Tax=Cyclostephanos tholiformis TaxID=382380 RepID=A0ABD3R6D7_9STRA
MDSYLAVPTRFVRGGATPNRRRREGGEDGVVVVVDAAAAATAVDDVQVRDGSLPAKGDDVPSSSSEVAVTAAPAAAVRLIEPSLCGRAEGVVRSVHDNYGFVSLAERKVDAYFSFLDMISTTTSTGGAGGGGGGGGGRYNKQQGGERESLRARRIHILPGGTVREKILIESGVRATVSRDDIKQPFVGTMELSEPLTVESAQRHPLVARLLAEISGGKFGPGGATFHDALSDADAQVVIAMVNARHDLEWSYAGPENAPADTNGLRLRIAPKDIDGVIDPIPTMPAYEASISNDAENVASDDGAGASKEGESDGIVKGDMTSSERAAPTVFGVEVKQDSQKKKGRKAKVIKSVRFDKSSFQDISVGPLIAGDIVTCDVFLSRRTGSITVENISVVEMVERNAAVVSDGDGGTENPIRRFGLTGFVTEVVQSRQFGFITAVDENGFKTGEHVFFHFSEVESGQGEAQDGISQPPGRKKFAKVDVIIDKGEEVKFDVGPGKNGKLNATNIHVLPRGTLKFQPKVDTSSSCTGYILIEPSYTSLVHTPSNVVSQSSGPAAGVGRWANVRDDKSLTKPASIMKEGVIMLLSDPSNLFSLHLDDDSLDKKFVVNSTHMSVSYDLGANKNSRTDAGNDESKDNNYNDTPSVVGTHIGYKLSSTAARVFATGGGANRSDRPRRGDLVSFSKTRGARIVKDLRLEKRGAATSVVGLLIDIDRDNDSALFVSSENDTRYEIKLTEVVSCDKSLLKDKEQVDGILHEGKIFGVCRAKDISLASSFGRNSGAISSGLKDRPKLNLTVKKELQGMGGQIMAQSRMAKGPDGTNGFDSGWTTRVRKHAPLNTSLSASASEFVPNFSNAASGFDLVETGEVNVDA